MSFGYSDPKQMPPHFFWGNLGLDYSTAMRADCSAQDFTISPRHWYIDAHFRCASCGCDFVWSAAEQKAWFETYRFYVDSQPRHCRACQSGRRDALHLRREYDALVSVARSHGTTEQKQRIVQILGELESYWSILPEKMRETRDVFRKQLSNKTSNDRNA